MNPANTNPSPDHAAWRRLPVEWLERPGALPLALLLQGKRLPYDLHPASRPGPWRWRRAKTASCLSRSRPARPFCRAFTILELMLVVGIIGLIAAMALPHVSGFNKANAMTAATRQLLDDVGLARQRALANRAEVCLVFSAPPTFWRTNQFMNAQITNLFSHQYSAYALVALRSVGDQPGKSNVHYLTDWRYLPQGIYISPFQFTATNGYQRLTNWVSTTNTTIPPAGLSNGWPVTTFPTDILFPFPSTFNATTNYLPYIGFTPGGQLTSGPSGGDQFIMLTCGSIFYPMGPNGGPQFSSPANLVETPPGNAYSNPNLVHIDWLTARAKIERNQF